MKIHGALALIAISALAGAFLPSSKSAAPVAPIRFHNVAAGSGIDFVLENSPTAEKQIVETMPGGVAIFDYYGDGLPDIFFANGADVPSIEKNARKYRNRLFRNLGGMKVKDGT